MTTAKTQTQPKSRPAHNIARDSNRVDQEAAGLAQAELPPTREFPNSPAGVARAIKQAKRQGEPSITFDLKKLKVGK